MIVIRLGGCDYETDGSTVEDCVEACKIFEKNGVDLIHITGGMNGFVRPGHTEAGCFYVMKHLFSVIGYDTIVSFS